MADIQHIDVDSEEFENAPRALRDHVRKIQRKLGELESERDGFKTQLTERTLGDVLTTQGFKNPKRVQRDLLSDGVDPLDTEAVNDWLEDNAGDYAKGDAAPSTPAAGEEPAAPAASQEDYDRLNAGRDLAEPADLSKVDSVIGLITPEMDGAQVAALYAKHGI